MMVEQILLEASGEGILLYLKDGRLAYQARQAALSDGLKQRILQHKAEIQTYLEQQKAKMAQHSLPIVPVDRVGSLPLSFAQQRLLLLDQIEGGSSHYHISAALVLRGKLDKAAIQWSVDEVVRRHEVLRSVFVRDDGGEVWQQVRAAKPVQLEWHDAQLWNEDEITAALEQAAGRGFDLSRDVMLRVVVLQRSQEEVIAQLTMHHIASDGWSMGVLVKEFTELYRAGVTGTEAGLAELAVQYGDYAVWQRDYLQGEVLEGQLNYWREQLADVPVLHSLPLDKARPKQQSFAGGTVESQLDTAQTRKLKQLCQQEGATLFMGLHAAFSALLSRYSNETDIVIGSPVANREQAEVAGLIGFFVNTLVLRSEVSAQAGLVDLIRQSRETCLGAYAHQQVPFEKLVEVLQVERSLSHSALFQVMLVLQNNEQTELELPGLQLSLWSDEGTAAQSAKFDLTLTATEAEGELRLNWNYNSDLFEAATIARLAGHFKRLVSEALQAPEKSVHALALLGAEEVAQLDSWNNTAVDYPRDVCIHQLFEAQALLTPDAVALVCGEEQLSYSELNRQADQLAHYLKTHHQIGANGLVGLYLERSIRLVVGLLGILKAGGAYLPLDPAYPQDRILSMLQQSGAAVVLTDAQWHANLADFSGSTLLLDSTAEWRLGESPEPLLPCGDIRDLAYVIYTSGSTGTPKGVEVEHRSLVNYMFSNAGNYFDPQLAGSLLFTSLSFDLTLPALYLPLLHGQFVELAEPHPLLPESIVPVLLADSGRLMRLTPSHVKLLLELIGPAHSSAAHVFVVGGEAFDVSLAQALSRHFPNSRIYNHYGPSEATIGCCSYPIDPALLSDHVVLPIGKPMANTALYVLSEQQSRVPVGVVGELYIGGAGLARGYRHRADLTAERFIENPYDTSRAAVRAERLYRTGDLVRYLPDGELEIIGRADSQIKIRGFRIEPAEIEAAMLVAGVCEAVVVGWQDPQGHQQLVGYYRSGVALAAEQLRAQLSRSLPSHLVPGILMQVEGFVLSANGKIDRKALPAPDVSQMQAEYVAPQTEIEQKLAGIWQQLLGIEQVGRRDNFFTLGGHSLLAMRLASQIRQQLGVSVALRDLFEHSDLVVQAALIAQAEGDTTIPAIVPVEHEGPLPLSFAQQRLWLLDQIDGGSSHYHMPVVLELTGELDVAMAQSALQQIVQRHEVLRTTFDKDVNGEPYQIVHADAQIELSVEDVQGLEGAAQASAVKALIDAALGQPFDLSRDVMLRVLLVRCSTERYVLVANMHHIASDGWSMGVLVKEFTELYRAGVTGTEAGLAELAVQYGDYAVWQRDYLQGEVLETQLNYWREQLADVPVLHSLPLDKARPKQQSFAGGTVESQLDTAQTRKLKQLCQQEGATLFMGLHAAFSALLSRYSNETDIVIGSPVANREQAEVAGLIGFFVNTLVLRSEVSAQAGLVDLIRQSRETCLGAYAHQQVPFEKLVEVLQVERSLSHSALFQVMLVLQNNEQTELELPGLRLKPMEDGGVTAKFDLTLSASEVDGELQLSWNYNSDLFEAATITRLAGHFKRLVSEALQAPEKSVHALALLGVEEVAQLDSWNNTAVDYPRDVCIHQLFEAQVAKTPDAVALVCGEEQLSYSELNRQANQLAHYLRSEYGVTAETLVGICQQRSIALVVSVLAVLKAGGAYVPLDPDYPAERLGYICTDAGLGIVLCDEAGAATLVDVQSQLLKVWLLDLSGQQVDEPQQQSHNLDAAYVIYTSGSTGQPKGVVGDHRNIVSLIFPGHYAAFSQETVMLGNASISFDAATFEWWGALLHGGRLVMNQISADLNAVIDCMQREQVNTALLTSGLFDVFVQQLNQPLPALRYLLVGGDVVNPQAVALMQQQHPLLQVVNAYGPTENTTISTTCSLLQATGQQSLPIGKPLANRSCYVLNSAQQRVPVGVAGELYVGGEGIARGYLNRNELTAERFIASPFRPGERLYRTGDIVQFQPDGELLYLGRNDNQLKIRGYRIEPGEIETCLLDCPGVNNAVVIVWQAASYDKHLIAYVCSDSLTEGANEQLKTKVAALLPAYMVPAAIIVLPVLPLTVNGKVDRKTLPVFDPVLLQSSYQAPATKTEQVLCEIFCHELKLARVGATDNFFQLGGSSLSAMRIISQIQSRLKKPLQFKEFFRLAQVDQMALHLDSLLPIKEAQINVAPELAAYPLSYAQQGVFIEYQLGRGASYNIPTALKLGQDFSLQVFDQALNMLIRQHSSLRTQYVIAEGEAVQIVVEHPAEHQTLCVDIDSADLSVERWECSVRQDISAKLCKPLDISAGVMLQSYSYTHQSGEQIVLLNFSHIAVDGWSIGMVVRDLANFYHMIMSGAKVEYKTDGLRYVDYAYWQRKTRSINKIDSYAFWQKKLEPFYDLPPIKTDFEHSIREHGDSKESLFLLKDEIRAGVSEVSRDYKCSDFNVWSAIYSVVTAIYNGHEQVCMNTDFANRTHSGTEHIIGMFVNQVVLSSTLDFSMNFDKTLDLVNTSFSDAISHSDIQFKEILQNITGAPKNFGEKLMSHKFSYQELFTENYSEAESDLYFSEFELGFSTLKYDLSLVVSPVHNGVSVRWIYNKELFKPETIVMLNELLVFVVENVLLDSFVCLGDIRESWNKKLVQYHKNKMSKFKFKKKEVEKDEI